MALPYSQYVQLFWLGRSDNMCVQALVCSDPDCGFTIYEDEDEFERLATLEDRVCEECGKKLEMVDTCVNCGAPLVRIWRCPCGREESLTPPDDAKCRDCGRTPERTWECMEGCDDLFRIGNELVRRADLMQHCVRDRLDRAFHSLGEQGIVARQDVACCLTCGTAEMHNEVREALSRGRKVVGYAFYHQQDTQDACKSGELYIAYASLAGGPEANADIGRAVAEAIRKEGLVVEWDGSPQRRLCVLLSELPRTTEQHRLGASGTGGTGSVQESNP
jgi:hypothetical protein